MLVTFDGPNKKIIVNQGVTDIDVGPDLYSEWKRWVTIGTNSKYPQAFRTFGGDITSPGQSAPRYYFLMNGWRVVIDGQYVRVKTNLYSDDGQSPFILLNGGEVSNTISDSPTIFVDGSGSLTPEEHNALMALSAEIFSVGDIVLDEIQQGKTDTLQAILSGRDDLLTAMNTSKAEILAKLESENDSLSQQLESARAELADKLNTITELSMNYKYKAFV